MKLKDLKNIVIGKVCIEKMSDSIPHFVSIYQGSYLDMPQDILDCEVLQMIADKKYLLKIVIE